MNESHDCHVIGHGTVSLPAQVYATPSTSPPPVCNSPNLPSSCDEVLSTFPPPVSAVLQQLTYDSSDVSEDHYLSRYSLPRDDDVQSLSQDRVEGMALADVQGSDESLNSYRDEDVDWDEGEESDVDGDGGSESEPDLGREVLDDERDFFAKDDSGEEQVMSRYIVSGTLSGTLCSVGHGYSTWVVIPP